MKKAIIFSLAISLCCTIFGQDFNSLITQTSDTLAKKIVNTGKKKIAITDFLNNDESITQLGTFLSSEISSELANLTDNQTKFRVLERANLDQIFKEKHLVSFSDPSGLAKELGKIDAADILIFATITDFDGYYRVVIKMLDTKNGDALSSYKVSFVKTPSLENLNKVIVKKGGQANTQTTQNPPQSKNSEEALQGGATGDYCFKNIDRVGYKASVSISRMGKNDVLKSISVGFGETNCMYELPPGIYTVTVSWSDRWANAIPNTTQEIRVKSGLSGTLEIQH